MIPCCPEFGRTRSAHTEICPGFEINDPARYADARTYGLESGKLNAESDAALWDVPDVPDMNSEDCRRCGGPNFIWNAPSPLWNAVMRGGSINGPEQYGDLVCLVCFVALAEEQGIATEWRLTANKVNVPLETVTPTGRVWNAHTWLWEDRPRYEFG